jgi:hypothetical protein
MFSLIEKYIGRKYNELPASAKLRVDLASYGYKSDRKMKRIISKHRGVIK